MSNLEQREFDLAAKLKCYASGSGVLSFTFCSYQENSKGHAISEKITVDDIQEFLQRDENSSFKDYVLIKDTNSELALMLNIKRLDKDTLLVPMYQSEPIQLKYRREVMSSFGLKVVSGVDEVQHISTKSAIKYFLDNEGVQS